MPATSFSVTTPSANAANADGYVQADGFFSPATIGSPIGTNGKASQGQAIFPSGTKISGLQTDVPQLAAAAGSNSQSAATLITASVVIATTVSATTRAFRLPAAVTGLYIQVFDDTATNCKVYPGTNATIGSASTNTALAVTARKSVTFVARSATHWVTQVGA